MPGYGAGGYGTGGYGEGESPFSEPLSYYLSIITSQYQNSPKFLSWIQSLLKPLDDITICLYSFYWQLDLDVAVGPQLDLLGEICNRGRIVNFQPSNGVSPILDDTTYRLLLKATIGSNFWNGTINGLQHLWKYLFPTGTILIFDNQDMSFTVTLTGAFTSIIQDLIMHDLIVPRPEGVKVNYTFAQLPLLGFDQNTAFVAGFDLGHFT